MENSQSAKKIVKQKAKIKSLKVSINQLNEENSSLKNQLIHLEDYAQSLTIEQKKNQYNQNSQISNEQSLLIEISHLKETIQSLEGKIDKMARIDNRKTQDIELLTQKVKDLEIIAEESSVNANYDINKLTKDNEVYRSQLNEVDKVFESFNYFVKRMSAMYPSDIPCEQIPYLNIKEYQNKLIQIENCIVNEKNKISFELKGLDDEHYNNMMILNKKIKQLTIENNELEERIKVKAKKSKTKKDKEKENRSLSSEYFNKTNGNKVKKTPHTASKAKTSK